MSDDIIKGFSVNKKGFGTIPKLVMQDTNLHIASKAIYAYFNSYAGCGDTCFPTRKKICYDLGISNDTFGKYLKQLVNQGYIEVEQIKERGKFSHNVYTICSTIPPCPKKSDTVETDAEISGNGNLDTNINNDKTNNSKNNNTSNRNRIDYQQIADMYNDTCVSFPKVKALSEGRKKAISARLKTYTVEQMQEVFTRAERSNFLKGGNDRNWFATFDWLMKDSNMAKVLEGNYENRGNSTSKQYGNKSTTKPQRELTDEEKEYLEFVESL